jgi:hypothetical protein
VSCSRQRGAANYNYKGGVFVREGGRALVWCRDGTQMYYYRAVMAGQLGRLLEPYEHVHHRNGDPTDDRPENLELVTAAQHMNIHRDELERARCSGA